MGKYIDKGGKKSSSTRIKELKIITENLIKRIYESNNSNKIGFVPFSVGVKDINNKYCMIPFILKNDKPTDFIKEYNENISYNPNNIKKFINKIEELVDINKTYEKILDMVDAPDLISMSLENVGKEFCVDKKTTEINQDSSAYYTIPLTDKMDSDQLIKKIKQMRLSGDTFITSALLYVAIILHRGIEVKTKKNFWY